MSFERRMEKLIEVEREMDDEIIHHIHKKYNISKKTLLYSKEYGPHSNIPKVIVKESIKVLIFASLISAIGGYTLEKAKLMFFTLTPIVVLMPALNDMIGDYGTILSSRFSTMLWESEKKGTRWLARSFSSLVAKVFSIAAVSSLIGAGISLLISSSFNPAIAFKIFMITILDAVILITILIGVVIAVGYYLHDEGKDPSNFLIPITTSIVDVGSIMLLVGLTLLFF